MTGPLAVLATLLTGAAAAPPALGPLEVLAPTLEDLYADLHRRPELSGQETRTAAVLAERLRAAGFEVTEKVGGLGVVGVLRNGSGPTLLIRTEMDALPVKEETGLPFASTVTATDAAGQPVPVMHACGHDLHMAIWVGTATLLAKARRDWSGTVVMVGQPAEEVVSGARAMLADGLFKRFPKPDFALAVHDSAEYPVDRIAMVPGWAFANVNTVELVVRGRGGHGALPHRTVDPVVLAARIVTTLQTLVARETKPTDPAVVTVGSIHGGTKANVIPDDVTLLLTVRSYDPGVQKALLEGIARIAKGEAIAARAPEPTVTVRADSAQATWNDPEVTARLRAALARALGPERVVDGEAVMASEDFSEFGKAGAKAVILRLGVVDPAKLAEAKTSGVPVPPLHSARFAPELKPSIRTGVSALTVSALELLGKR